MGASAENLKFEQHKAVEDDQTIVLPPRKNKKRKLTKLKSAKQQLQEQTQWTPTDLETTPERELRLMQKMQISIEKLEKSQFFSVFLDQVRTLEASDHFAAFMDILSVLASGSSEATTLDVFVGIGTWEVLDSGIGQETAVNG
ncbi:hypothetical protein SSX86_001572 [Deinandra increscens subsp. villosa]|uniref:Uncharacterized protein n=1 Tax=Deinandra increscens subsp. villosa TaxID=3103831 RepID=A0AAP0DZC1_9ASTR